MWVSAVQTSFSITIPTVGGELTVTLPIVLGHECAGIVTAVGDSVRHIEPGDKVALEPGVPCGK